MSVNIHDAKTHLSRLVDRAAAGEEIVIAHPGKPVAKLVAYAPVHADRTLGTLRGRIEFAPDLDAYDEEIERLFMGAG